MEAANAASAKPFSKISTKCSGDLAPPEAITGTVTAFEIAAVSETSKPLCVPSRSTEVNNISPAPHATTHYVPMIAGTLCVDGDDDGLRAKFAREFGDKFGTLDCGGVHGDFVRASADNRATVFERSNAAAGGERNGQFRRDTADGF